MELRVVKSMANHKVIIIDDDRDMLMLLMSAFKARGIEVQGMTTGKEALDFLLEKKNLDSFSLIILDRILPDMDGLEVLKQFLDKFHKKTPVIILSSLSTESDLIKGIGLGAIDYVTKPCNITLLVSKAIGLIEMTK